MNTEVLKILLPLFAVYLVLILINLRKLPNNISYLTALRMIFPKVLCMSFALGIAYGFMNHPDQEPRAIIRNFEIVTPLVLSLLAIVI